MTDTPRDRAAADAVAATALAGMVDAQVEVCDALVAATQAQIRALIDLRVHRGGGAELAAAQAEIQRLTFRLEVVSSEVRQRSATLAETLGLPPAERTLTELALALPRAERDAALARVSALRSLGQALAELQAIAQAHAQRGLHAVAAWRTVIGAPHAEIGATYTRRGRARSRQTTLPPALSLDLDL